MMKRILCLLLALATVFTLCACGGDNNKNKDKTEHPEVGARTLIAAAQQESGEKSAARLVGMEDTDFGAMVKSYLGVDPAELYDGAMALSEDTAANEIIVLVPKDADSMKKLIDSLNTELQKLTNMGYQPIVLTSPAVRLYFRKLVERSVPGIIVLSQAEIEQNVEIQILGVVKI